MEEPDFDPNRRPGDEPGLEARRPELPILLFFCGLALVPLWSVRYPPMADLAQHAAQVGTWLRWDGAEFDYSQYLWVNWRTPYLLTNTVAWLLAHLVAVPVAFKIVLSWSILGIPLVTAHWLRHIGGRPLWALATLPVGYSFAFYMGFGAYAVATPLALLFVAIAWRYAEAPSHRGGWQLLIFSQVLFLTHVIAFGWAGLVAAGLVAARAPDLRATIRRWWPLLAALPLPLAWLVSTMHLDRISAVPEGSASYAWHRLLQIPSFTVGWPIDHLSVVLGVAVLATPFVAGARPGTDRVRWIPFGVSLALLLLVPNFFFGTAYLHQRFAVFLLPTLLFALDPGGKAGRRSWLVLAPALIWLLVVQARMLSFRSEVGAFRALLDSMEPHRLVLYLPLERNSPTFPYPVFEHFGCWYQAEKGGLVDYSFAEQFPNRFRYREEARPRPGGDWHPARFDYARHDGHRYDYFLVRSSRDPTPLFWQARAPVRPLGHAPGGWWLYGRATAASEASDARD